MFDVCLCAVVGRLCEIVSVGFLCCVCLNESMFVLLLLLCLCEFV